MSIERSETEAPWRASLRGARATFVPGLVLQAAALALVFAYYNHAATRAWLAKISDFRAETGLLFGMISTGLVGGVIPFFYLRSRRVTRARYSWAQGLGLIAFWSYKGAEIELFYRLLANVVGEGFDVATIATKMVIDQFVYCPAFAVPVTVLVYAWIDAGYRMGPVLADWKQPGWYRRRVLPILIPNLAVWIPAVCIIYALPTPLQLPLQNVVLCFYTLLLAYVTQESPTSAMPAPKPTRV
jgi:hypothetical protein